MLIISRNDVSMMIPTQIFKTSDDEASIMFHFENWNQPGIVRKTSSNHQEWSRLIKLDADPIIRKVLIGSVQSGQGRVIRGGSSRICIHSVFLSPRFSLEVGE